MTTPLPIIGVTGGIGSGKSLVANILKENGCVVADADENTKVVLHRKEVQQQLVEWWGAKVLDDNGNVDRAFVASIVFVVRYANDATCVVEVVPVYEPLIILPIAPLLDTTLDPA